MSSTAIETKVMLAAKEVARMIGKSARTVRRWAMTGEHGFPAASVRAGHPRWRRVVIEAWVREQEGGR